MEFRIFRTKEVVWPKGPPVGESGLHGITFARFCPAIIRFAEACAAKFTGVDYHTARDVGGEVAQTMWNLFETREAFRNGSICIPPYVRRVAYTTTLQHFRKRRLAAEADAVFLELCHLFLDEWPDPERRVELEELANVLGKEFRKLPKKQKEVIVLLRQLGHSHEEAAEITGTSVNNVKALVMRATTRLRERLERYRLSAEIPRPGRLGAPQPSPQLAEAGR